MKKNYYISGSNNLVCDTCSKKIKAGDAYHRWDGLIVCHDDWEERHPQDFVRARTDKISVENVRPQTEPSFVPMDYEYYFRDSISFSDSMTTKITYHVSMAENIILMDNMTYTLGKGFADSIALTDSFTFVADFQPGLVDQAVLADSFNITYFSSATINGHVINTLTLG